VATLKTYGRTLWDLQQTVGNRIGFDLRTAPLEFRALIIMVDASLALLIKALVDKGVFNDLELNAAVQGVRNTTFARMGPPPLVDTMATDQVLPVPEPLQD
jgi:hypothetical protein